ncbi:MAG: hypothetical protein COS99_07460 [Candidatus Omnitrophica bacterium CG07_land_8_20_14_0_80_42_15]|uniref:CARDB domain-containing protein n=1 Tax=Candidatus Aquitaenariimonas noxiae TaxID=1974741 RepID=A0A2J0KRH8_9BACT|nr:MAG: hypothetical protein COS99_07460 [Candidatus Omnitrophica bacterium CG07_land_8_20_14_0_80_42_15]
MKNSIYPIFLISVTLFLTCSNSFGAENKKNAATLTSEAYDSGPSKTVPQNSEKVFGSNDSDSYSTASGDISREEGLPDLMVSDVTIDFENNIITSKVTNLAKTQPLRNLKMTFYCSGQRRGREKICDKFIPCLNCGPDNAITVSAKAKTEQIYRQIEVMVDPEDDIKEKDEKNNCARYETDKLPPPGYLILNELDFD